MISKGPWGNRELKTRFSRPPYGAPSNFSYSSTLQASQSDQKQVDHDIWGVSQLDVKLSVNTLYSVMTWKLIKPRFESPGIDTPHSASCVEVSFITLRRGTQSWGWQDLFETSSPFHLCRIKMEPLAIIGLVEINVHDPAKALSQRISTSRR